MRTFSRRGVVAALATILTVRHAVAHGIADHADDKPPPAGTVPDRRRYADADRCQLGSAFEVVNDSAVPIMEVYVRQSGGTGRWGEDQLGERVLRTGQRIPLDPGSHRVDVLMLREDGRVTPRVRHQRGLPFSPCARTPARSCESRSRPMGAWSRSERPAGRAGP